jgi:hypothetical protein
VAFEAENNIIQQADADNGNNGNNKGKTNNDQHFGSSTRNSQKDDKRTPFILPFP